MSRKNSTTSDSNCDYIGLRILLIVFKSMGLAPFDVRRSISQKKRKKCAWQNAPTVHFSESRFGRVYNSCLVPLQVLILIYTVPIANDQQIPHGTSIMSVIDTISCVICHSALFSIWLMLGFRQKTNVRLLNRLFSFDCTSLIRNASPVTGEYRGRLSVFLTCAMYIVISAGALYTVQLAYGFLVVTYIRTCGPSLIIAWFVAQYGFVVKLIGNRLETLNRTLLDCNVSPPLNLADRFFVVQDLKPNSIAVSNIADLRRAHMDINRIACKLADFYSIPILLSVANHCYQLICCGHYLAVILVVKKETMSISEIVNEILWISNAIVPVVILAASVTNVVNEVWLRNSADPTTRSQLTTF